MRKILFRAVAIGDLKTMVYGYYHYDSQTDTHYICLKDSLIRKEIDPDTLGQFTGLTDKNGKEIWENDVLICNKKATLYKDCPIDVIGLVIFSKGEYEVETKKTINKCFLDKSSINFGINPFDWIHLHEFQKSEVIGNLHENPELL